MIYRERNNTNLIDKVENCFFIVFISVLYISGDKSGNVFSNIILWGLLGAFGIREVVIIIKSKAIKTAWFPLLSMVVFASFCALSSQWAFVSGEDSIGRAKTIVLDIIMFATMYGFFSRIENGKRAILYDFLIAGTIFSIFNICYYGLDEYFALFANGNRIGREINNQNMIGLQTAIPALIAFYLGITENRLYLLCMIIPTIVALGTGSKKVIIILLLGCILLPILNIRTLKLHHRKTKDICKGLLVIACFVAVFLPIAQLGVFDDAFMRFEKLFNFFSGDSTIDTATSTAQRTAYITYGMNQFFENALVGIGAANSEYVTFRATGMNTYLHNNYVELLCTVGIVGFLLYYSIWAYIVYIIIKKRKERDPFTNLAIVLTIIMLVLEIGFVSYYEQVTYFYITIILVLLTGKQKAKKYIGLNQEDKQ